MRIFKKAQGPVTPTFSMLPIVFFLVFLAIVGSTTLFFTASFIKTKTDVTDTYAGLVAEEALTANYGITYVDVPTQRNYITTIDLARFEDSILESSVHLPDNRRFAARFVLKKVNNQVVKEAYLNKAEFIETRNNIIERRTVTINQAGNEYPGILEINVRIM